MNSVADKLNDWINNNINSEQNTDVIEINDIHHQKSVKDPSLSILQAFKPHQTAISIDINTQE